ncbi:hypothetical protein BBJ28_00014444 [Nothophytophthora sp. Chile5]|nr:hypothetical protein BBJ28_00014444 [Nothophytophthora sp. Chile5]
MTGKQAASTARAAQQAGHEDDAAPPQSSLSAISSGSAAVDGDESSATAADQQSANAWKALAVTFAASGDAMLAVGNSADDAPPEMAAIAAPRCRRQVWLRNARGERLGYAASWINEADVGAVFKDTKIPIGSNILRNKTELFRDMKSVFCGESAELEEAFGMPGPFWGRSYLFWNGGRPVTFIYEVFSPALEKYMGEVLQ